MKSRRLTHVFAGVVAIGLIPTQLLAQATTPSATEGSRSASWENLRQLSSGQKIQVVQKDLKSWTGYFVSVSDDSVSLRVSGVDKTVGRADVFRVSRHGGKRLRNALIGAGIAGGAGVAVGAAAFGGCSKGFGFCISRGTGAGILGGIGAVIGGGVGAAFPGSTVIYRAPAK